MAANHHPAKFLTVVRGGRVFLAVWAALLIVAAPSCLEKKGNSGTPTIAITGMASAPGAWNDVFERAGIIRFSFPSPEQEIYKIGGVRRTFNSHFIISDSKVDRIYEFGPDGRFIRRIGNNGPGPGEYLTPTVCAVSPRGDLFVFDAGKYRIIKYRYPDYTFETEWIPPHYICDMIVMSENRLLTFVVGRDYLLEALDGDGKIAASGFPVSAQSFHLFQDRFQLGRLHRVSDRECIVTYPLDYTLHFYDGNLNPVKRMTPDGRTRFTPAPLSYPEHLPPGEFTPAHSRWWSSAAHISGVQKLGRDLLAVKLWIFDKLSAAAYMNIHTLDGKTMALGLPVPGSGEFLCDPEGRVYAAETDQPEHAGAPETPVLVKYRYKRR